MYSFLKMNRDNGRIRRIDNTTKVITTIIGGGANTPFIGALATNISYELTNTIHIDTNGQIWTGSYSSVWELSIVRKHVFNGTQWTMTDQVTTSVYLVNSLWFFPSTNTLYTAGYIHYTASTGVSAGYINMTSGVKTSLSTSNAAYAPATTYFLFDARNGFFMVANSFQNTITRLFVQNLTIANTVGTGIPVGDSHQGYLLTNPNLNFPLSFYFDAKKNDLYFTEYAGNRIRRMSITSLGGNLGLTNCIVDPVTSSVAECDY
jgi:hypothetical protein